MINDQLLRFNLRTVGRTAIILVALLAAAAVGTMSLIPKNVLILLLAIPVVTVSVVLIASESAMLWGFGLWIATLAVGWRGLWVTSALRFYAPEVVIVGLFILMLTRMILHRQRIYFDVPLTLFILIVPIGILAVFTAYTNTDSSWLKVTWDTIWAEYKPFLVALPIFAVTGWVATDMKKWKTLSGMFIVVIAIIALLGTLETVTGKSLNIFGTTDVVVNEINQEGLTRAAFSFWGHNGVVALIFIGFAAWLLPAAEASRYRHWPTLLCLALACVGIYVAGQRGSLISTALALIIFVAFDFRHRWWLFLPVIVVLFFLPDTFWGSFLPILGGANQLTDTSLLKRVDYSTVALGLIQRYPLLGHGWGAAGWVHDDYLQLAADLGIPALLLYVFWYIKTCINLVSVALRSNSDPSLRRIAVGLFAALMGLIIIMSSQVIFVFTPLVPGVWFLFAMVVQFIKLNSPPRHRPGLARLVIKWL